MPRDPYDGSPEFTEALLDLSRLDDFTTCTECGALVREHWQSRHVAFHLFIESEK